jgi:superfamily II DNA helicase RecQ
MRDFCNDIVVLEIDNQATKKNAKEAWTELMILLDTLCQTLGLISAGEFTPEAYSRIRTECQLKDRKTVKKKSAKSAVASKFNTPDKQLVVNEELRDELLRWRTARFKKENVSAYTIMHQSTLLEIAARIPQTMEELSHIKGMGKIKCSKYGAEVLSITAKFDKFADKEKGQYSLFQFEDSESL